MRPPAPTLLPKKQNTNLIIAIGLVSGLLITISIWLKLPNQVVTFLSISSLCLISLGSFLYIRWPLKSHPRWIIVLAAIAAISLIYLFPKLFGPTCGGVPRAFARPSASCAVCLKHVCEWNYKKHQEWCYCDEWDTTGCTVSQPPTIQSQFVCSQWGQDGWCAGSFSLSLTAVEPQGADVMIYGEIDETNFTCPASPGTNTCVIPLPEGSGIAYFTAISTSELTASGSATYSHDSTKPKITGSLSGTNGNNGWFLSLVDVNASASDPLPGSGIAAFAYKLDGNGWGSYAGPLSLSDGVHNLILQATDQAGNIAETAQTIKVDTVMPSLDLSILATAGSNEWYRSKIQVTATASDSGSGLDAFEYDLNNAGWIPYNAPLELNDGIYHLGIHIVDAAGNETTWSQSFKVDTTTPALNMIISGNLGASGWYTSPVQVKLTAYDPGSSPSEISGLSALEYNLDSTGWMTYSAPLELGDGPHNLEFRATDIAGNATSGAQSFQVDTAPPKLDVNVHGTQGTSSWYTTIVQVEAVVSDLTSNLSTLETKIDGGDWNTYTAPLVFGNGQHSYRFRARDNAGNFTTTSLESLYIDTVPPSISLPGSWDVGETAEFELQDSGSGLASVRLVIEDEDEHYPKVSWEDPLSTNKFEGEINWNGRFKDGTVAPPNGEYYAWLKVTDKAGNESQAAGQVKVPLASFVGSLFDSSDGLVFGIAGADPIQILNPTIDEEVVIAPSQGANTSSTLSFGGSSNTDLTGEQSALNLGGVNNGAVQTTGNPTGITSFNAGGLSNSPLSNASSNLLWGATAAAAIGAFTAELTRKKEEREAAKRAANTEKNQRRKLKIAEYTASLKNFKATLHAAVAMGMAEEEAAKLQQDIVKNGKIGNSLEATKDFIAQKEADAEAQDRYVRATRKEELLEPEIPPESSVPAYYDTSWKQFDYAQTEHSQEVAAAVIASQSSACTPDNIQKEQSWWDKTLNWVDQHQKVVSIATGVGVGLATVGVVLAAAATAVVTLPVILVAAGVAAVVAGTTVGIGTVMLNSHFGRELTTNIWSNIRAAATPAALTAGLGLFVLGGGLTSALITGGNSAGALCLKYQTACNNIEPVMKGIDFAEEAGLVVKGWVQTMRGDSAGAAETALELQMEYMDGGVPGNAIAKEVGDDALETIAKYGDDATYLLKEYGEDVIPLILSHGDDAIDIIGAYGDEGIILLYIYGDKAIDVVHEYGISAVGLLRTLDLETTEILLKNLDADVIDYALAEGSDAVEALSHWPQDFLKKYGDELALRAKQDARALDAASKLVKLKDLNSQEAKELLDTVAYNSVQNSGDRIVLGKWVSGTLDEGFIGVARADGALFYGTNPGIEEIFAKAESINSEDLYWAVKIKCLK